MKFKTSPTPPAGRLKKDVIEVWYYKTQQDYERNDPSYAIGYIKIDSGKLVKETGVKGSDEFIRVKSTTQVIPGH